jgi:hypothetical protein
VTQQYVAFSSNQTKLDAEGIHNKIRKILLHERDRNSILALVLILVMLFGGTVFLTSDKFLNILIQCTLLMLKRYSEDKKWNLEYGKVTGCFFCGGVSFNDFKFEREFSDADQTNGKIVTFKITAEQVIGFVTFNRIVKQIVKMWIYEKMGWKYNTEEFNQIIIPRLALMNAEANIDIKFIDGSRNEQDKAANDKKIRERNDLMHILFGDLRIYNSTFLVNFYLSNGLENKKIEQVKYHIDEYESLEAFNTKNWLFNFAFRSTMKAKLDGCPFNTDLVISDDEKHYNFKWDIETYPLTRLFNLYIAVQHDYLSKTLRQYLGKLFADKYISISVSSSEIEVNDKPEIKMNFNIDLFNGKEAIGELPKVGSTLPKGNKIQFDMNIPISIIKERQFNFVEIIVANIIQKISKALNSIRKEK